MVTQKERGLVMKHDKAIIDLTERESSAKKAPGTTERKGWNVTRRWRRGQGQVTGEVGLNPNTPDAKSLGFGKLGLAFKNKQKNAAGLLALSLIKQYLKVFEVQRSLGSSVLQFIWKG